MCRIHSYTYSTLNESLNVIIILLFVLVLYYVSYPQNSSNFYISNTINGSDTSHTITYSNRNGDSCGSVTFPTNSESCGEGTCRHLFNVSSSSCPPSDDIIVTLLATNVFGNGPMSDSITVGKLCIGVLLYMPETCNHSEFLTFCSYYVDN